MPLGSHQRVPPPLARRGTTQRAGLLAAAVLALAFLALIAFFVVRNSSTSPRPATPNAADRALDDINIEPPVRVLSGDAPTPGTGLGAGRNLLIPLMDRADPARIAGELLAAKIDPLEARRYLLESPAAWIYQRDGSAVHVRSDRARVYIPDRGPNSEPESGTFEGSVLIPVFGSRPDGSAASRANTNPAADTPLLEARTDTLNFDLIVGELSTSDRVVVSTADVVASGRGFRVVFNQPQARLELLELLEGESIRFSPPPRAQAAEPTPVDPAPPSPAAEPPSTQPTTAAAQTPASPAAPAAPSETLYRLVFTGNILLTQRQRTIKSDRLDVWIRLIDNRLPPDAVRGIQSARAPAPRPAALPLSPATLLATLALAQAESSQQQPAAARTEPRPLTRFADDDVTLTWTGSLVMTPITDSEPPELAADHVYLRFTSPGSPGGTVAIADAQSGLSARCLTLDYAATARLITLTGDDARPVIASIPDAGELTAPAARIDLASGTAEITGAGTLIASDAQPGANETPAPARTITWARRAEFAFSTSEGRRNADAAALGDSLEQAIFEGDVSADDSAGTLRGDRMQADFSDADPSGRSLIQRLTLTGTASASADSGARSLAAATLTVDFTPLDGGRRSAPATLSAVGNVTGQDGDSTLSAERLDAVLEPTDTGNAQVVSAIAQGNADAPARFRQRGPASRGDIRAEAPLLRVQARDNIVELEGDDALIADGPTVIRGSQIRVAGIDRTLTVFGSGTLEHEGRSADSPTVTRLTAAWTRSMTFDDVSGKIECAGDVSAIAVTDGLIEDRITAERVQIAIEPRPESSPSFVGPPSPPIDRLAQADRSDAGDRPLLSATALSAAADLGPEAPGAPAALASVQRETRDLRQTDHGPAPARQQLMYLEGAEIYLDNAAGTVRIPGAGQLLVDERRSQDPADSDGPQGMGPGTTLVEWSGSLLMTQSSGSILAAGDATLTHRALEDNQILYVEAQELTASIQTDPNSAAADPLATGVSGRLTGARARTTVFARTIAADGSVLREIQADDMDYDARTGIALMESTTAEPVTVFEPARAATFTARRLRWDLKNGRIDIIQPGTGTAPR